MTHHRGLSADDSVATAAAIADTLFAAAAERDAAAADPDAALRLLHDADLMMAPFPVRLGLDVTDRPDRTRGCQVVEHVP